jgi:hypothetical protein
MPKVYLYFYRPLPIVKKFEEKFRMRRSLKSVFRIIILFISIAYSQTTAFDSAKNAAGRVTSLWTTDDIVMAEQAAENGV